MSSKRFGHSVSCLVTRGDGSLRATSSAGNSSRTTTPTLRWGKEENLYLPSRPADKKNIYRPAPPRKKTKTPRPAEEKNKYRPVPSKKKCIPPHPTEENNNLLSLPAEENHIYLPCRPAVTICPVNFYRLVPSRNYALESRCPVPSRPAPPRQLYLIILPSRPFLFVRQTSQVCPVPFRHNSQSLPTCDSLSLDHFVWQAFRSGR